MNPRVSVIIPAYNRSQLISETLKSVSVQTYTNWECIVVDDGSTDNTIEIVKNLSIKDSRFSVYKRPPESPKGANVCRNYGFKLSKGEYILFLDSDDILKSTCLEKRLKLFKTSERTDFVLANSSYIKEGVFYNKSICEFPIDYKSEDYFKLFLSYKLPWTIMSVLWKKVVIQGFKFDENLTRLQDIDYHISILSKRDYSILRLNEVDTYYRVEDSKALNQSHILKVLNSFNYFLKKHINQVYIQEKYSNNFKGFIVFFLTHYLYPNIKNYKLEVEKTEEVIKESKIFNFRELNLLNVQKLLISSGLINKKGLGINRINKFLKKGLMYE
ncbi:glycosyltransferase family 2 protein [Flavivirga sp. 57AJ16]|uniref:glycosyltransferase family 2 protein n=1 Tax=Flavivirga sp. 57AJ16 TaxID=3025307 RepID=UPI002367283E|nr:glycosyltransferase family 2 protein [Flavivirga sp. 57AJ16]MDD7885186.1 glycosyltransferase family 2 protein [Flavivirga sp. 57AJ16]